MIYTKVHCHIINQSCMTAAARSQSTLQKQNACHKTRACRAMQLWQSAAPKGGDSNGKQKPCE
ncbi:MAG: hypothetical protein RR379_05105 [Clostridia bacterium]